MIDLSPVGLSTTALTANQVSVLATITERLGTPFCVDSTVQPQVSVSYLAGTPKFNGSTVFVPITATVTISVQAVGNRANTHIYTETFDVAFQGQTAVPTSITVDSAGRDSGGSNIRCGKARSYTIHDSLTVTIA